MIYIRLDLFSFVEMMCSHGFSQRAATALYYHLEERTYDIGEDMEVSPRMLKDTYVVYPSVLEAYRDITGDRSPDPECSKEYKSFCDEYVATEFDGGVIIRRW